MSFGNGIDLAQHARWMRQQQEAREREKAARASEIGRLVYAAIPEIQRGSVAAMKQVAALLCERHNVKVDERTTMPSGASAYAIWGSRTIVVPPIVDEKTFAVRLHELGHVLQGECPGREPHRPDPNERRWHHCIACESDAWRCATALVPFSREMHETLRNSLQTYRRMTPASASALQTLDQIAGTVAYMEERLKWIKMREREWRMERAKRELENARRRLGCRS